MKYRSNSILAFIPQNKEGELILNQTLYFQQSLGMRLFILDILKPTSIFTHLFQTKKRNSQISEAKEKLHRFVENIIQKEIPRNLILRIKAGDVLSTLIKESKKGGYEFIVADKSEGNFKGVLSRNEIDKFISRSHCPVLTVSKDFSAGKISKIIIPIDISQTTKKHLYWATFFAKEFNAQIQIVSALNINIDETKSLAFRNAEKIKKMLIERGIKCEVKILKVHSQKKHKIILDYIGKEKPELVIIRKHQESMFSGKKIGDFVSEIIHGCQMPVFAVGGTTKELPYNSKKYGSY